jgi:hypothetical protein
MRANPMPLNWNRPKPQSDYDFAARSARNAEIAVAMRSRKCVVPASLPSVANGASRTPVLAPEQQLR